MTFPRLLSVGMLIGTIIFLILGFGRDNAENVTLASQITRFDGKKIRSTANGSSPAQSEEVFDCSTYESKADPILPPLQEVFQLGSEIRLASVDDTEYISGLWSPNGSMLLMSSPDGGIKIEEHDVISSDDPSPLVAVGTSSLFLHAVDGANA